MGDMPGRAAYDARKLLTRRTPDRAILGGVAEQIPLREASVNAVLATAVLCAVRDQARVLAEVRRALRPVGTFVFAEHVAARGRLATLAAQATWGRLTSGFFEGCRTGRRTWNSIDDHKSPATKGSEGRIAGFIRALPGSRPSPMGHRHQVRCRRWPVGDARWCRWPIGAARGAGTRLGGGAF